jgi:hypothetical protein
MLESAGAFVHLEDSTWASHSEPDRKATDWAGL